VRYLYIEICNYSARCPEGTKATGCNCSGVLQMCSVRTLKHTFGIQKVRTGRRWSAAE
jgi:hypothetical protein